MERQQTRKVRQVNLSRGWHSTCSTTFKTNLQEVDFEDVPEWLGIIVHEPVVEHTVESVAEVVEENSHNETREFLELEKQAAAEASSREVSLSNDQPENQEIVLESPTVVLPKSPRRSSVRLSAKKSLMSMSIDSIHNCSTAPSDASLSSEVPTAQLIQFDSPRTPMRSKRGRRLEELDMVETLQKSIKKSARDMMNSTLGCWVPEGDSFLEESLIDLNLSALDDVIISNKRNTPQGGKATPVSSTKGILKNWTPELSLIPPVIFSERKALRTISPIKMLKTEAPEMSTPIQPVILSERAASQTISPTKMFNTEAPEVSTPIQPVILSERAASQTISSKKTSKTKTPKVFTPTISMISSDQKAAKTISSTKALKTDAQKVSTPTPSVILSGRKAAQPSSSKLPQLSTLIRPTVPQTSSTKLPKPVASKLFTPIQPVIFSGRKAAQRSSTKLPKSGAPKLETLIQPVISAGPKVPTTSSTKLPVADDSTVETSPLTFSGRKVNLADARKAAKSRLFVNRPKQSIAKPPSLSASQIKHPALETRIPTGIPIPKSSKIVPPSAIPSRSNVRN